MIGAANIPSEWVKPLNDTLNTAVSGLGNVKISELAHRTLKAIKLSRVGKNPLTNALTALKAINPVEVRERGTISITLDSSITHHFSFRPVS